jgi:hypothetical protein
VPDLPGGPSEAHPYHQWVGEVQPGTEETHAGGEDLPEQGLVSQAGERVGQVEQSEEWLTGRRYLDMSELAERCYEERAEEGVIFMDR